MWVSLVMVSVDVVGYKMSEGMSTLTVSAIRLAILYQDECCAYAGI